MKAFTDRWGFPILFVLAIVVGALVLSGPLTSEPMFGPEATMPALIDD